MLRVSVESEPGGCKPTIFALTKFGGVRTKSGETSGIFCKTQISNTCHSSGRSLGASGRKPWDVRTKIGASGRRTDLGVG